MTTKRIQLFSRVDEFLAVLNLATAQHDLVPILYSGQQDFRARIAATPIYTSDMVQQGIRITRIYLAPSEFSVERFNPRRIEVARLGLIQITLPVEQEGVLLLAEVAVKTDWLDGDTQECLENRDLLIRFREIKKRFVACTFGGVIGTNILTGKHAAYPAIRYTQSAKEFFQRGGELRQEGVRYVVFSPALRASDK